MKRTIISAAVLALVAGGAGAAVAGPYPNGNNDYGLCMAYTKQSENRGGPNEKGANQTFQDMAAEWEEKTEGDETFAQYCSDLLGQPAPGNSDGKGNKG